MELRQLKIFCMVAKIRNFTRAGELLGYAQSNVTAQIQSLEAELDTKLFERLGKRVLLTPDGEKLLQYSNNILEMSNEVVALISKKSIPHGTITIGVSESLCVFRFPQFFKEYHRRYPGVKLVIKLGSSMDFPLWINKNLIDIAIFLDNNVNTNELISKVLLPEPVVLVASPSHPAIQKGRIHPEDIKNECLIQPQKGCSYRASLEKILSESGIQPYSTLELDSIEAIKHLVISGLGIALLPLVAVTNELDAKLISTLNWAGPEIQMYTQVVYHKDKWISPTLLSVLELIKELYGFMD